MHYSRIHWPILRSRRLVLCGLATLTLLPIGILVVLGSASVEPLSADTSHNYIVFLAGINSHSSVDDPSVEREFSYIQSRLTEPPNGWAGFVYFSYGAVSAHQRGELYCAGWGPDGCSTTRLGNLSSLTLTPIYISDDTHLSIIDQAAVLDWLLRQIIEHDPLAVIDLVGYSLGGIVASQWVASAAEKGTQTDFYNYIHSIVLIESPVGGLPLAGSFLKDECDTDIICLLWELVLSDWFGTTILEQLQLPEDDPGKSIIGSLPDASRFFDLTSIQSIADYLVNDLGIPICDQLLSCITSSLVTVGHGSQYWVGVPQTLYFDQELGGQGIPRPDQPRFLLLDPSAKDLIFANHSAPISHPIVRFQ